MIMKLLIINPYKEEGSLIYESQRLIEESTKLQVETVLARQSEIVVKIHNGEVDLFFGDNRLKDFDIVIAKGKTLHSSFIESFIELIKYHNIIFLNDRTLRLMLNSKNNQMIYLTLKGIPVPDSEIYGSVNNLVKSASEEKIIKPSIGGGFGKNVKIATDKEINELIGVYSMNADELLIQEKLPNKTDYRVLVLDGKSLGVMKKVAAEGQLVSNYKAGGTVSVAKDKEVENLAVSAANALECDYAGVDIMYDSKGNPKVLEINKNPGFKGFEEVTGINVAEKIISYLIRKKND